MAWRIREFLACEREYWSQSLRVISYEHWDVEAPQANLPKPICILCASSRTNWSHGGTDGLTLRKKDRMGE